ncbi:MAG: MFS transporter [Dictyoglomaceae bacterium]|nr:MFS transporter [Dictyoglomaceae bacterium]
MNNRFRYFIIVYFISLILTLNMQSIPPLIPHIIKEWNIKRAEAGLLMGIVSLPPLIFGIFGGYILDNFGVKIPTIISLIFYLIGQLIFILAKNFSVLLISRLILGIGAITLAVVGFKILAEVFQGENLGRFIGLNSTAMPISTIFSFNLFGYLARTYSWKTPMFFLFIFTFIYTIFFIFTFNEEKRSKNNNENFFSSVKDLSKNVWILGLIWLLFNAGSISFLTFAPDFFISKGFSYSFSSSMSSFYMIGALFSPIIGFFLDKTKKPQLFIFTGALFLSLFLTVIYYSSFPLIFIIVAGFFSTLLPPSVFYLLPKLTNRFGLGYSVLSSLINLGILLGPAIIGFAKDISGDYFSSFISMSFFILLSGILALTLKPK